MKNRMQYLQEKEIEYRILPNLAHRLIIAGTVLRIGKIR